MPAAHITRFLGRIRKAAEDGWVVHLTEAPVEMNGLPVYVRAGKPGDIDEGCLNFYTTRALFAAIAAELDAACGKRDTLGDYHACWDFVDWSGWHRAHGVTEDAAAPAATEADDCGDPQ